MNNLEIERKFIIPLEHHHLYCGTEKLGTEITQAYLSSDPEKTIRIRIAKKSGVENAFMTIKSRPLEGNILGCPEWEWDMPVSCARDILKSLSPPSVTKTRHYVMSGGDTWEVDVVPVGDGRFLVVAEIEGSSIEQVMGVAIPPWVGPEVTGDKRFSMVNLVSVESRSAAYELAYK